MYRRVGMFQGRRVIFKCTDLSGIDKDSNVLPIFQFRNGRCCNKCSGDHQTIPLVSGMYQRKKINQECMQ